MNKYRTQVNFWLNIILTTTFTNASDKNDQIFPSPSRSRLQLKQLFSDYHTILCEFMLFARVISAPTSRASQEYPPFC